MPLTKKCRNLFLHLFHLLGLSGLDGDHPHHPWELHPEKPFLGCGQGNEDHIILIRTPCGLAFRGEDTDDIKRDLLDPNDLTDGINPAEKIFRYGPAENTDLCHPIEILLGKGSAKSKGPLPDLQNFRGCPVNDG